MREGPRPRYLPRRCSRKANRLWNVIEAIKVEWVAQKPRLRACKVQKSGLLKALGDLAVLF